MVAKSVSLRTHVHPKRKITRKKSSKDHSLWRNVWTVAPALLGLAGVLAGTVLAVATTSYVESIKQLELRKVDAVAGYVEAAWGNSTDGLDLVRKLSLLSTYAPADTLKAIRAYHVTDCTASGDEEDECRRLWADVVSELRKTARSDTVTSEVVIDLLFGE